MNAAGPISQDQWQIAIRTLKDLLALQMKKPGAILVAELPDHLRTAADGRERQGDHGAARMLERWALLVTQPMEKEKLTDPAAILADLEQMEIASTVLLSLLRLTLKDTQAMDQETAARLLMMAADERDRQGDYGAAKLLDDWAQQVGEPMGDGK